jgi:hypothetical protein
MSGCFCRKFSITARAFCVDQSAGLRADPTEAGVVAGDENVLCRRGQFAIHDHGVNSGAIGFLDDLLQGRRVVRQDHQCVDALDHQVLDIADLLGARTRGDNVEFDVLFLCPDFIDRLVRPPQQTRGPAVVR